jgi:hypothetical protein
MFIFVLYFCISNGFKNIKMNDEIEMVEEFQSENINDLILERKKKNAVQYFLTQSFK